MAASRKLGPRPKEKGPEMNLWMAKLRSMKKSKPKGRSSRVKSTSPRFHSRKSKPKMKSRKSRKSRK